MNTDYLYPDNNYIFHTGRFTTSNDCTGDYSYSESYRNTRYRNVNRDFGNNTSYVIYGDNTDALAFHIDDEGALYINHPIKIFTPTSLNTNSIVEDVFADFINDPTSGVKYTRL